ncbi:hypothetical protein ACGFZQ_28795 [Streptomyces sp. NPDC048254]|uniref:hypothetical protein n=1 Tax=Streptomyces sp. NPDC048254 TaxID=3365525 RepID=UPI00371EE725
MIRRHQALVTCAFSFCWAPGSPDPQPVSPSSSQRSRRLSRRQRDRLREGPSGIHQPHPAGWPKAIRAMARLAAWTTLQRCWRAWTDAPPPAELQALINAVGTGHALDLCSPV